MRHGPRHTIYIYTNRTPHRSILMCPTHGTWLKFLTWHWQQRTKKNPNTPNWRHHGVRLSEERRAWRVARVGSQMDIYWWLMRSDAHRDRTSKRSQHICEACSRSYVYTHLAVNIFILRYPVAVLSWCYVCDGGFVRGATRGADDGGESSLKQNIFGLQHSSVCGLERVWRVYTRMCILSIVFYCVCNVGVFADGTAFEEEPTTYLEILIIWLYLKTYTVL